MRRNGFSMKVQDSSQICQICSYRIFDKCCLICKRKICSDCICDNDKYCLFCNNSKLEKIHDTIIRVPTDTNISKNMIVKKSKCCFM